MITAIIISFNEAGRITDCLKSLEGIADEIVLVDNGSTDGTQQIAKGFGVKIFQQEWLGYGQQKNFALSKATHQWVLHIDCDERLDEQLRKSIMQVKKTDMQGAYEVLRLNNFYGKFIRHGLQFPDKNIRIWNKQDFKFDDKQVHESLKKDNDVKVTRLKGFLLHYSYYTLEHHIEKNNRYTSEGAEQLYKEGKKNYWWKIWVSPPFTFFRAYIIKKGFLDGWHGFVIAKMEANITFMKYAKLWEKYRNDKNKT